MIDLSTKTAVVLGAGGLGCPAAVGLAAHGIGALVLVDHDVVDATNLGRQSLFGDVDVGRPKVVAATLALAARFPDVRIQGKFQRFDERSDALLDGADVVLDATDDFAVRFLTNDLCVRKSLPFVHGAALQWLGQVLPVVPRVTPCLRCVFEGPPVEEGPTCARAGVATPLVGVIGAWMADAAVSLLVDGPEADPALRVLDAWSGRERRARVGRDPRCPSCGSEGFSAGSGRSDAAADRDMVAS